MLLRMIILVFRYSALSNVLVYCSDKRNNVNILFEHAQKGVPFELTKIVVKVNSMVFCLIVCSRLRLDILHL